MNRKRFLQRTTLAALATAGFNKFGKTQSLQQAVSFQTPDNIAFNDTYIGFSIKDINLDSLLNKGLDSQLGINISINGFPTMESKLADKTWTAMYQRKAEISTKKNTTTKIIPLTLINQNKTSKLQLPEKLDLYYSETAKKISFEYMKGKVANLYKSTPEGGGEMCFLTTACTLSRGLPDNCQELQTLRRFRNDILQPTAEGAAIVSTYYRIAPEIVQKVNAHTNAFEIWNEVYNTLIIPTIEYIDQKENDKAIKHYKNYVLLMEGIFGSN